MLFHLFFFPPLLMQPRSVLFPSRFLRSVPSHLSIREHVLEDYFGILFELYSSFVWGSHQTTLISVSFFFFYQITNDSLRSSSMRITVVLIIIYKREHPDGKKRDYKVTEYGDRTREYMQTWYNETDIGEGREDDHQKSVSA